MAMHSSHISQVVHNMRQSLFDEGILDAQFLQIEALAEYDNPDLLKSVVDDFTSNTPKDLISLDQALTKIHTDLNAVRVILHKLKSTSLSIGASKFAAKVVESIRYYERANWERLKASVEELKEEIQTFQLKINEYLRASKLARQILKRAFENKDGGGGGGGWGRAAL